MSAGPSPDAVEPSGGVQLRWTRAYVNVGGFIGLPHAGQLRFGSLKYVYPKEVMGELRSWFQDAIAARLPSCRVLYWT